MNWTEYSSTVQSRIRLNGEGNGLCKSTNVDLDKLILQRTYFMPKCPSFMFVLSWRLLKMQCSLAYPVQGI
jgi:hypothetical protein